MAIIKNSVIVNKSNVGARYQGAATDKNQIHRRKSPPRVEQSNEVVEDVWSRYRRATASKLYDVEELVDFYFHRRLAAVIAVVISYLPFVVTPNQITLFGLMLGWASSICVYDAHFHTILGWNEAVSWFSASFLTFWWIVSDCADGQVARLCKRGTRTGRILDGVVDGLVIIPNMVCIGLITKDMYGEAAFYFTVASGLSLWVHAIVYDKIKNVYMERVLVQSECDGETAETVYEEFLEAKKLCSWSLDCYLLWIYYIYLHAQDTFTNNECNKFEQEVSATLRTENCDFSITSIASTSLVVESTNRYKISNDSIRSITRTEYIRRYGGIVRLASFMGISAHVVGLYMAYFFAYFWKDVIILVQIYFFVVQNFICSIVLFKFLRSDMMRCTST